MRRIHDLSYPLHTGMSTYPAPYHPRVEITQVGYIDQVGRESRRIVVGSHSGTHVDAPSHFLRGGRTIDRAPLTDLVGQALMLRFPSCPPGRRIEVDDLASETGDTRPSIVVLRFDWSTNWGREEFYRDYPYLSADACRYLAELGVKTIGSDTPSVDDPRQSGPRCNPDSPNHKYLLQRGISLVEYLTNLQSISAKTFTLVAAPLAVRDGDGAPARVLGIENESPGL